MRRTNDISRDRRTPSRVVDAAYPAELHRYLVRQLRNQDDAMELAQEAYVRYLQVPNVGAVRNPAAYLFRIALNLMSEWRLRRDRSVVTVDSQLAENQSTGAPSDVPGPIEQLLSQEHLEKVLEQIPVTYRRVLLMSKCDGLTNAQIAAALQVTPETVTRYLGRALSFARRVRWE